MLNALGISPRPLNLTQPPRSQSGRMPAKITNQRFFYCLETLKYLALIPLFPALGYFLLDQPGISQSLVQHGIIPAQVMGEGFGHVGLCFSIHYVIHAIRSLFKTLKG